MENLTILKETDNPLLKRKEIEVSIEADVTPQIQEAEEIVSKKFSTNPENIKIKKIQGKFGSRNFIITVNVYSSKDEKERIESKQKKKKAEEKKE